MNPSTVSVSRRSVVRGSAGLAAACILGRAGNLLSLAAPPAVKGGELPRRKLGKTGVQVPLMVLGTAPAGHSVKVTMEEQVQTIELALDLGIDYFDCAPIYGKAEECLGRTLGKRRKDVFLTTKVWANTAAEAEKSLAKSMKLMKTDYIDLLYMHNIGDRKMDVVFTDEGVWPWLLKQKQSGRVRFIGASGHARMEKLAPFVETGKLDAAMFVLNFVDHHVYGMQDSVLGLCRKHGVGVVAMKVFGGIQGGFKNYTPTRLPCQMPVEHIGQSIRYAAFMEGVDCLNIGVHDVNQLLQDYALVQAAKPLADDERQKLLALGKPLAEQWGPRFGPVKVEQKK